VRSAQPCYVTAMTPFAVVLATCAGSALVALLLSGTRLHRFAGQLARFALWATLAAPLVAVFTIATEPTPAGVAADASLIGRGISLLINQAAALVPTAFMASFALQRSRATRAR
jgi:hypothetical protein